MKTQHRKQPIWGEIGLIFLIVALVLLTRYSNAITGQFLNTQELRLVDVRFLIRGPLPPRDIKAISEQVTIVGLDTATTHRFGHPLPRAVHAQLVQRLQKAGARAIIFDILFADPDRRQPDNDRQFATACARAGNVFLPFDDDSSQPTPPDVLRRVRAKLSYPLQAQRMAQAVRLQPPIAPLFEAMRGGGHIATKADSDSKFRSAILLMESGALYPHTVLDAVVRTVWNVSPQKSPPVWDGQYLKIGAGESERRLGPLERESLVRSVYDRDKKRVVRQRIGSMWTIPLNFIGGHETMQALTVPYLEVLDGHADDRIKNRIVIVGETATGTPDLRPSPFDQQQVFLGVETNATFIANLLNNDFLRYAPLWWAAAATLACALLCGLAVITLRPALALIVSVGVVAIYGFIAMFFFWKDNTVLEMTAPLLATALCYTALTAYRLVFADRVAREYALELRETEELLGLHVNPRIAQELRDDPETRLAMQIGTRREVTVLFSDIRGFTSWSDRQTPEEVKSRLDEYFPVMCEIANDDYDGYIDKFIGDALMVVWNCHKDHPDHAERAVRAALSMQRALAMLNDGWRRQKQEEFRIGIGIATGPAVFGTFGSSKHKLMPTTLGSTVNLASRLETMTKETGSYIIIAEETYQAVKDRVEVKFLGQVPIRGKSEAQSIYEVLSLRE